MKNLIIISLILLMSCISNCGTGLILTDKNMLENDVSAKDAVKIADYIFLKNQVGEKLFNRLIQFGIFKHDSLRNLLVVDTVFAVRQKVLEPWNNDVPKNVDAIDFFKTNTNYHTSPT